MPASLRSKSLISFPRLLPWSLLRRLDAAHGTWRQRQKLSQLDDHLLRDVGLTREDAIKEAERPVWDAPEWWR